MKPKEILMPVIIDTVSSCKKNGKELEIPSESSEKMKRVFMYLLGVAILLLGFYLIIPMKNGLPSIVGILIGVKIIQSLDKKSKKELTIEEMIYQYAKNHPDLTISQVIEELIQAGSLNVKGSGKV